MSREYPMVIEAFQYHYSKRWGPMPLMVQMDLSSGTRIGYVGVTPAHPLYEVRADHRSKVLLLDKSEHHDLGVMALLMRRLQQADGSPYTTPSAYFAVHGGVITGKRLQTTIPTLAGYWWFIFDANHFGDAPDQKYLPLYLRQHPHLIPSGEVRTVDFMLAEAKNLARQLSEIEPISVIDHFRDMWVAWLSDVRIRLFYRRVRIQAWFRGWIKQ